MKLFKAIAIVSALSQIILAGCSNSGVDASESLNSIPDANFTISEKQSIVGKELSFSDASTDADNDIILWIWNFGDGSKEANTKNPTHIFDKGGYFSVKLIVQDKAGHKGTVSKQILIKNVSVPEYGSLGVGIKEKIKQLYPKAMVCAHRADHENYPENSLPAIQAAIDNGIQIFESDARLTVDNQVVLMHDPGTLRTTNANYVVSQKTLTDLKKLKLLFNGNATTYEIPTLKEALLLARGKIYMDIDISWDNTENYYTTIYNEAAALNMTGMVFFYTENAEVAKGLMKLDSDIVVLLGAGNSQDWNNANSLNPKPALWHLASKTLNSIYTTAPFNEGVRFFANAYVLAGAPPQGGVDDEIENLLKNKVSIIQTDYNLYVKKYLQSKNLFLN